MSDRRRSFKARAALGGLAAGLALILTGDRGVLTAVPQGIDPLEVLNLQVKNNVLFVFDTSGSMKWPTATDNFSVGGDDPLSRMYQAKQAVKSVITANAGKLNFGLLSYNVLSDNKSLNRSTNFDGDNRLDGPFIYVSADFTEASPFYTNYTCPNDGNNNRDGFFCRTDDDFTDYNGTGSADVFQSFQNRSGNSTNGNAFYDDPYPPGCNAYDPASGPVNLGHCRFYLQSKLFRSGQRFSWNLGTNDINSRLVSTTTVSCPLPPAGLVGDNPDADGDGLADRATPCIEMVNQATGQVARFYYTSALFQLDAGEDACDGAALLASVTGCTGDNSQAILDNMRQELLVVDASTITGLPAANTSTSFTDGDHPLPVAGLRADQATPIAGTLNDVRTTNFANPDGGTGFFPPRPAPVANIQKNFVVFLSDGDDTCASTNLNTAARTAALAAQNLYANTGDPQHQAETMFIAFASAINIDRANWIAQAGSGGIVQAAGANPQVTCPDDVPCRNAFTASTTEELIDALNSALQLAVTTGTFAASPTTIATVFELADDPGTAFDEALDPLHRYDDRVNILYQPTFDLPGFNGHLFAFQNDGTLLPVPDSLNPCVPPTCENWDAGETLFEVVSQYMEAQTRSAGLPNKFTFAELHASATVDTIGSSTALVRRRIFTSQSNGSFPRTSEPEYDSAAAQGRNVVALWPPNQAGLTNTVTALDPAVGTPGDLDDELGIASLTFAELKSQFGACDVSADPSSGPLPSACNDAVDLVLATDTARKEARQAILAFTAGARLDRGNDNKPVRNSASEQLFRDRGWLMIDSTYSQPAVVTPPLRNTPPNHIREFLLFRDGRRDPNRQGIDEIDKGFGLRNPDIDDTNPETKQDLKPVMTVVYYGSNAMLHAFRAETSEEVWGFVPYDQLVKLKDLMKPQVRDPHVYMIGSSIRAAFVFVPGPFTLGGVDYDGRWRTVIVFGRGAGGKYYSMLDVTAPGPFTRNALETNPPWVMWNRGNPDTLDGTLAGTPVRAADTVAYAKMGQTWSIPAIGNVKVLPSPAPSPTPAPPPGGFGPEWRLWTGSGYGETPDEGTTFYALDIETGDVLDARDIGDGTPTYFPDNALVAGPAAYNPFLLDNPSLLQRSQDVVTRVYIPDIHGRIWKFAAGSAGNFADEGPTQPFADGVALMKLNDVAFVYAEAGNDNRLAVPPSPTPPFKMFVYRDDAGDLLDIDGDDVPEPGTPAFDLVFPERFRANSRPATAFNEDGQGRVFFLGQQFNPPLTADCLSSFDTILFAVGAETGGAVYDFGSGYAQSSITRDSPPIELSVSGGRVNISGGGSLGAPPSPAPGPSPSPYGQQQPVVRTKSRAAGSPVCRD